MVAQTAATILPIGKRCLVPTWLPVSPHAADNAGAIRRLGTQSYIAAHGFTRKPKDRARDDAQRAPRALTKSVLNSDGRPGQQHGGAKRDQLKSRPIRFNPKAAGRSFRFQRVAGSRAKPRSTT